MFATKLSKGKDNQQGQVQGQAESLHESVPSEGDYNTASALGSLYVEVDDQDLDEQGQMQSANLDAGATGTRNEGGADSDDERDKRAGNFGGSRVYFNEQYWSTSKFGSATYWEDEVDELNNKAIPVHAYYINNEPKVLFEQIAERTGGQHAFLEVNSPGGAELIAQTLTTRILRNIGGDEDGESLVHEYYKNYPRMHVG